MLNKEQAAKACEDKGRNYVESTVTQLNFTFEDYDYSRNDFTAENKKGTKFYVGEIKGYFNPEHPRYHNKAWKRGEWQYYPDYMIDYDKLQAICEKGKENNRTPILIAAYHDTTLIWNLNEVEWESTGTWRWVNKCGVDYGTKERSFEAFLPFKDAYEIKDNKWVRYGS